jgi:hypothetical protein
VGWRGYSPPHTETQGMCWKGGGGMQQVKALPVFISCLLRWMMLLLVLAA